MIELYLPPPKDAGRIAVAMSGGVDSSVVAALIKEQGYDVIGITLALQGNIAPSTDASAAKDAKKVADFLNIPHHIADLSDLFKKEVIDPFVDGYLQGETPLPCARCNKVIKFGALWDVAREMGATYLVTGHYIRYVPEIDGSEPKILQGEDKKRDQSFFLSQVPVDKLRFVRFPLGQLSKDETRAIARRLKLEVHDKPDSQDICFVPTGRYTQMVEKLRPGACSPGDIVHVDGRVLGQHKGIIYYTVGQRRGIEIGGGDPLYVVKLNAAKNQIIVGSKEDLYQYEVHIKELNWLEGGPPKEGQTVIAKLRSAQALKAAKIYAKNDGSAKLIFSEPQDSVAPGQICGIYDGERLLGGGCIV